MIVDEVMSRNPASIAPGASVRDAARLMRERRVGCVLVVEAGRAVGMFTESDLARLVAEGRDAAATSVGSVMSSPLITVEASADLEAAADLMRTKRVKRLAVTVGGEVRGVVTVRDLAYALPEEGRRFLDAIRARWED